MAFELAGASLNYLDLFDNLEAFATANGWTRRAFSQEALSAVVAAGGTGYPVADQLTLVDDTGSQYGGDAIFNVDSVAAASADSIAAGGAGYTNGTQTLTLVGGTFSTATTVDVTVAGGVVTAIIGVVTPGDYTVIPTSPVSTSGGGGAGATLNMTFGVVVTVSLVDIGAYHYAPTNPVSTTGTGTGCTLTVTTQDTDTGNGTGFKRMILEGSGSGSDEIFVGVQAQDAGGGVVGFDCRGFTGFQAGVDFFIQPGISPFFSYVPLNNGALTHWFFVNPSRIMMVARMATTYTNLYMGFINRFGTSTDFPYPLAIIGCSSQTVIFSNTLAGMGGMNNPMYHTSSGTAFGPGNLRTPGGQWISLANSGGALSFFSPRGDSGITPPGRPNTLGGGGGARTWDDFFPVSGGSPTFTYRQTPDSTAASGFRFPLIPCLVYEQVPQFQIHGELDNVYWAGTLTEIAGQATAEDVYNVNGDDYILFQNCNRTDHWTFFLIKKE